ncbi:MAG TPA: regulatory protein RecX [Nevskiales bacterium]|nr:regulatory protein RecX [Nevskiales bacterium]
MRSRKKPDTEAGPPGPEEVRDHALRLLARREHSTLELERKLLQRGYSPELIESTLSGLAAEGLLSETRYAGEWVRSRIARGQGPAKIRTELRHRGLTDAQIRQALAAAEVDWGRLAAEVRRKRFGAALPASLVERARQTRFLEARGFTAEHIRQALGGPSPE